MIGTQPTGAIEGVVISAVGHEGLTVMVNGRPARLAIVTDDGHIVAVGDQVAREAEAVAVNSYRETLRGRGFLRILSAPIPPDGNRLADAVGAPSAGRRLPTKEIGEEAPSGQEIHTRGRDATPPRDVPGGLPPLLA